MRASSEPRCWPTTAAGPSMTWGRRSTGSAHRYRSSKPASWTRASTTPSVRFWPCQARWCWSGPTCSRRLEASTRRSVALTVWWSSAGVPDCWEPPWPRPPPLSPAASPQAHAHRTHHTHRMARPPVAPPQAPAQERAVVAGARPGSIQDPHRSGHATGSEWCWSAIGRPGPPAQSWACWQPPSSGRSTAWLREGSGMPPGWSVPGPGTSAASRRSDAAVASCRPPK